MSLISRGFNFFVVFYCTFIHGMSENEPNSKNNDRSENPRRRPRTSPSTPIACRVCDRIFFDNVSLVLHFECHLEEDLYKPGPHTNTPPPSIQNEKKPQSLNPPKIYGRSVEMSPRNKVPKTNNRSKPPRSFPVRSDNRTDVVLTDAGLIEIPVLNSMPPLSPSFDARMKSLQHSSSSRTLFYPRARRVVANPNGTTGVVPFQSNNKNEGRLNYRKPQIRHLAMRCRPINVVIISDDDGDDKSNPKEMLDLTLRL
ncbi:hypothetical protein ABFS82_07G048900 [Erythranthe guttata]